SGNQLSALPEALGRLTALTTLNLSDNQLSALPEVVTKLTALTTLNLSGNQLSALPEALSQFPSLKQLLLHKNESLAIPPEVLGADWEETNTRGKSPADPQAILRFYFASKNQGRRPLAEAKVLVVGQGSVGKTSLIKYWRTGNACDGSEEKTTKIDITHHMLPSLPCPDGKTQLDIALNVWDFGGQEIYHSTHQFFLSKRSLYLLVLAARDTEDQNNVNYWFQMAKSFGGDSRVLVVINKSDEHRLDLNETRLRKDYGEQFAGVVRVSCKQPFGRDELTAAIRQQIAGMKDVFTAVPESYFTVKTALEEKAKKENFLPYVSYERLCNKHELKEAIDQKTLIRFLHDLGVVLQFDDPDSPYKLGETTILNPDWVTAGVYAILNNGELVDRRGVLTSEHLNRLLADKKYPPDRKSVVVGMMRKFELCFEFPSEEGKKWLVPQLLSANEPELDWREKESLNFRFKYGVLPPGLVCQFIVRRHGNLTARPTYWRSGVVLDIDGCRVLVRGDTAKGQVYITVQGPVPRRRAALAVIRDEFTRIHSTMPGLQVEARVPLPDEPEVTVSYQFLLELEQDGEQFHRPEGAKKSYRVADLLNGISTPEERERVRREPDRTEERPETPKEKPKEPDSLDRAEEKLKKVDGLLKIVGGIVAAVVAIITAIVGAVRGWFG
ncbi:MAG TPA: COR domain-containing protein, partial [Gemmata sp.]